MKVSLTTRIYRAILGSIAVTILLSLMAVELIYEDMEDTILNIDMAKEREYFLKELVNPDYQEWHTARMTAIFLGSEYPQSVLPEYLQNYPVPFSEEVEDGDEAMLISVEHVADPPGTLYLIQDISAMESREEVSELAVLMVGLLMLVAGVFIARFAARRISEPLRHLTEELQASDPEVAIPRLSTDYQEFEFSEIAASFNRFFGKLEESVAREKAFVRLASHELRTPIAVISGALDVISKRGNIAPEDIKAFRRIRKSTEEMKSDVEMLLKLARGGRDHGVSVDVNIEEQVRLVVADLESGHPEWKDRVLINSRVDVDTVVTDEALLRVLLRNLIQNALKHTERDVLVTIGPDEIRITDSGKGMPASAVARLRSEYLKDALSQSEAGVGLLIAKLVCEQLSWRLHVNQIGSGGTEITVHYG